MKKRPTAEPIIEGPFVLLPRPGRLRKISPRPGEILRHLDESGNPSGSFIMLCPYCGVWIRFVNVAQGPNEKPTMRDKITCTCRTRCARTFRIRSATVQQDWPDPRMQVELPPELRQAKGVFAAPVLNVKGG